MINSTSHIALQLSLQTIPLSELLLHGKSFTFLGYYRSYKSPNRAEVINALSRLSLNSNSQITDVETRRAIEIDFDLAFDYSRESGKSVPSIFDLIRIQVKHVLHHTAVKLTIQENMSRNWMEMLQVIDSDTLIGVYISNLQQPLPNFKNFDLHPHIEAIKRNELSENHAHLWATGPVFKIAWMDLMNNPHLTLKIFRDFGFEKFRLYSSQSFLDGTNEINLVHQVGLAAIIRMYLFASVQGNALIKSELSHILIKLVPFPTSHQISNVISEVSKYAKSHCKENQLDYANKLERNIINELNSEVLLIHETLRKFEIESVDQFVLSLLHIYINIKSRFRAEIVLLNSKTGFTNFQNYQDRKGVALRTAKTYNLYLKNTFDEYNQYKSFEARITPKSSARALSREIKNIESSAIGDSKFSSLINSLPVKYSNRFYVIHFIKQADNLKAQLLTLPRNQKTRVKVREQGIAIGNYIQRTKLKDLHVFGIDAASAETDCRPEVFATVFRELTEKHPKLESESVKYQLFKTYHVGEEFSDIADGLRAIYEAITFLELKYHQEHEKSDRIGHALALGMKPDEWYYKKSNLLRKRSQDHLDDLAFMIFILNDKEIRKHPVSDRQYPINYLLDEFYALFNNIFVSTFSIDDRFQLWRYYWSAFLLRGDCPFEYGGSLVMRSFFGGFWNKYRLQDGRRLQLLRKVYKVRDLLHQYHFSKGTRERGNALINIQINNRYVKYVTEVQKRMIMFVRKCQIAIESNPTSNLKIALINTYSEHPIFEWNKLQNSSNLNTSINTDDAGIMDTNLILEHSVIYESLISRGIAKHTAGKWIRAIIKHGNHQKFKPDL